MKKLAVALAVFAAACASSPDATKSAQPSGDPRIGELQTSMTELLERIDVLNDRVARLEQAGEQRTTPPQASTAQPPAQPPAGRTTEGPVLGTTGTPAHTPAAAVSRAVINAQVADLYRNGIVLFGKNQLAGARTAFQQVFDADPSGELADNALFWIGETYFAAGKYGDAGRFYKRVADDYAEQNKAPDALYKLALTYVKSGDLMLARTTLQDVLKRYPYSSTAASAKAELNRIKY